MRNVDYYFGRINIIAHIKDKKEFIMKGLRTDEIVNIRGFEWGFFEIEEIDSEIGVMIHGFLAKYKPVIEEETAEPDTHRFVDKPIENKVVSKSKFFINLDTNLIAYHPASYGITSNQFCENFSKILEQALGTLVNLEIQTIREQFEFYDELRKTKIIKSIQIYLHPSNPEIGKDWKNFQERLVKLKADTYHEEYKTNDNEGLQNIIEDGDIISNL